VVPDGARSAVENLSAAGAKLIGVSFGDPYLAADLPGLATYVAAYGDQPVMQAAAARALFGETEISGRLPVTIPGVAERGAGVTKGRMP
jgi:beta-N-acetylhexosaminidase